MNDQSAEEWRKAREAAHAFQVLPWMMLMVGAVIAALSLIGRDANDETLTNAGFGLLFIGPMGIAWLRYKMQVQGYGQPGFVQFLVWVSIAAALLFIIEPSLWERLMAFLSAGI